MFEYFVNQFEGIKNQSKKMKINLLLIILLFCLSSCSIFPDFETKVANLDLLVNYMEGSYSSEKQAKKDTVFLHITLDMKQIWPYRTDGAWMYVEQTAGWTPGKPYRQRIYHLEQVSENLFSSTICSFPNPKAYIGGHLNTTMFDTLPIDSLKVLEGCALKLRYENGIFSGSTELSKCENSWGNASYATSEVEISRGELYSWDRGWNDKDEQVWGAVKGGYRFIKQR